MGADLLHSMSVSHKSQINKVEVGLRMGVVMAMVVLVVSVMTVV